MSSLLSLIVEYNKQDQACRKKIAEAKKRYENSAEILRYIQTLGNQGLFGKNTALAFSIVYHGLDEETQKRYLKLDRIIRRSEGEIVLINHDVVISPNDRTEIGRRYGILTVITGPPKYDFFNGQITIPVLTPYRFDWKTKTVLTSNPSIAMLSYKELGERRGTVDSLLENKAEIDKLTVEGVWILPQARGRAYAKMFGNEQKYDACVLRLMHAIEKKDYALKHFVPGKKVR